MIDEVPSIRLEAIHRPDPTLVAALHGTPTGFIVMHWAAPVRSITESNPQSPSNGAFAALQ